MARAKRLIVGISGASGIICGVRVLESLRSSRAPENVAWVSTSATAAAHAAARRVMEQAGLTCRGTR